MNALKKDLECLPNKILHELIECAKLWKRDETDKMMELFDSIDFPDYTLGKDLLGTLFGLGEEDFELLLVDLKVLKTSSSNETLVETEVVKKGLTVPIKKQIDKLTRKQQTKKTVESVKTLLKKETINGGSKKTMKKSKEPIPRKQKPVTLDKQDIADTRKDLTTVPTTTVTAATLTTTPPTPPTIANPTILSPTVKVESIEPVAVNQTPNVHTEKNVEFSGTAFNGFSNPFPTIELDSELETLINFLSDNHHLTLLQINK